MRIRSANTSPGLSSLRAFARDRDKTSPGLLATCGFDDDGVKATRWKLIDRGIFVGYQTTREQAGWIHEKASRGCSYADSFRSFPFQRMPNVSLAPHPDKDLSLDD